MASSPTVIDISRVPAPSILEVLSHEGMLATFVARFKAIWAEARAKDPTLPYYDVQMLETDPAVIVGQAWTYLRLLDRQRVNDAVKAVLAPTAKGADLDAVVARVNIARVELVPANPATGTPAVMESDASLLNRYLLAFDRPSAGSADRYLYEAYTALLDLGVEGSNVAVIGRAIHGRRGDTDVVVAGPGGRLPTDEEIKAVRDAVTASDVKPEATAVTVLAATQELYQLYLTIEVGRGPDPDLVRQEALSRVQAAVTERTIIGGEVPADLPIGQAYGPNVIRAWWDVPFLGIPSRPYVIPVCTGITINAVVRA